MVLLFRNPVMAEVKIDIDYSCTWAGSWRMNSFGGMTGSWMLGDLKMEVQGTIDSYYFWLVVWLPFFIFPYIGNNHPNWLIFFRGVAQPPTRFCIYFLILTSQGLDSDDHLRQGQRWWPQHRMTSTDEQIWLIWWPRCIRQINSSFRCILLQVSNISEIILPWFRDTLLIRNSMPKKMSVSKLNIDHLVYWHIYIYYVLYYVYVRKSA